MTVPTTGNPVDDLVALMRLDAAGEDRFVGRCEETGRAAVFGGQLLGQALVAASLSVEAGRPVHSLHAYFLSPGRHGPIDYCVERVRDGRSFTLRRVRAQQGGSAIFEMTASFQVPASGLEHQRAMPEVPGPEGLPSDLERWRLAQDRLPEPLRRKGTAMHGIEYRNVVQDDLVDPTPREGGISMWMRTVAPLPDEPMIHRALAAYASDHGMLRAAALPHGLSLLGGRLRFGTLDHAMWFHRDFRFDDWLLYSIDSPTASGSRGLSLARLYTREGRLVASTAQEGLLRVKGREAS